MRLCRLRSSWLLTVSMSSMPSARNPSSTFSPARRLCLNWIVLKSSKDCYLLVYPARLRVNNFNKRSLRLHKRTTCWLCCKAVLELPRMVEGRRLLWINSMRSCRHSQNLPTRVTRDSLRQATSSLHRSSHFRRNRDSRVVCPSRLKPLDNNNKAFFGKMVRRFIHRSKTSTISYKTWLECPLGRVIQIPMDFTTTRRCRTRHSSSSRICQACRLDRAILARMDLAIRRCTTCRLNILPSRCSRRDKRRYLDLKCRVSTVQLPLDLQHRMLLNFHHLDFPRSP